MADHVWVEVEHRDNPAKWETVDYFESYEIDQDVMGGIGSFKFQPSPIKSIKKLFLSGEQRIRINCDDALQFTGVTDDRQGGFATDSGSFLDLTGRDMARWLHDVTFDVGRSINNWSLKRFLEYAIGPWMPDYVQSVTIDDAPAHYIMASKNRTRYRSVLIDGVLKKVKVGGSKQKKAGRKSPYYRGVDVDKLRQKRIQPGDSRIEKIRTFARQVGCFTYCTATGDYFVGRPSYDRVDYDTLVFNGGEDSNVKAATWTPSTGDRFATYKFTSQGRRSKGSKGASNNHSVDVMDPSPAFYRTNAAGELVARIHKPQTVVVPKGVQGTKLLRRLARTTVEEIACRSYMYEVEVAGHERDGILWAPNACVNVHDDYNGIHGPHYIAKRRFIKGMDTGTITVLHLIPAKIWLYLDHDTVEDDEWQEWINSRVTW